MRNGTGRDGTLGKDDTFSTAVGDGNGDSQHRRQSGKMTLRPLELLIETETETKSQQVHDIEVCINWIWILESY